MSKIIYVGMLCFCEKLMNNEVVVCWILNDSMFNCCWWCFETCCWWIGVKIMLIGELVMKVVVVVVVVEYLWKFGELLNFDKMVFESWVLSIIDYVFIYMTCKHHLERVLSVERSKLECLGKRVVYFEVSVFSTSLCFLNKFVLLNKFCF